MHVEVPVDQRMSRSDNHIENRSTVEISSKTSSKYMLEIDECCCGESNNFCGGTCLNHNAIFHILDGDEINVSNIQLMYAPDNGYRCFLPLCRYFYSFPNFALIFPPESNQDERIMLIAAALHCRFQLT